MVAHREDKNMKKIRVKESTVWSSTNVISCMFVSFLFNIPLMPILLFAPGNYWAWYSIGFISIFAVFMVLSVKVENFKRRLKL